MPIFRTTEHILRGEGEFYDPNWMDSDKLILPPSQPWDYQREMFMEDVNIWEVIAEPWDVAIYAAWDPYAEFYLVRVESNPGQKFPGEKRTYQFETYYGPAARFEIEKRMKELGLPVHLNEHWVEPSDMIHYSV
jgi:hypothetical protein